MIKIFKFSEDKQSYSGKIIVIGAREFKQSKDHQFIRILINGTRICSFGYKHITTEYSDGLTS